MAESTSSQERIVSLLWLFLNAGPAGLTKRYIRRNVDGYAASPNDAAFDRMFTRDKDTLQGIGVMVETIDDTRRVAGTEEGDDIRYRVNRDQLTLPDVTFTQVERLSLQRARALWEGSDAHSAVVRALGRLDRDEDWLTADQQADLDTFGARLAGADRRLVTLEESIRSETVVEFGYRTAAGGPAQTRQVQPWLLLAEAGQWYVVGWDLQRQGQRMFRVTRFTTDPTVLSPGNGTESVRKRPADLDVEALRRSVTGETTADRARLLIRPGQVHWLRARAETIGPDTRSGRTQGWDQVEIEYSRPAEFAGRLASAGDAVLVDASQPDIAAAVAGLIDGALDAQQQPAPHYELVPVKKSRQRDSDRDKVAALVDIVGLVNQRGKMTRRELAARLGLSETKLDSYLATLMFCGMPERFFAGEQFEVIDDGEYIQIRNAQALERPLQLSVPEAQALLLGLQLVTELPGLDPTQTEAARSAREKITAVLPEESRTSTQSLQVELNLGEDTELAADLHRAAQQRRVLELTYHAASRDEISTRQVEPLRVEAHEGHTYLRAWCRLADALRNFRLDRIASHSWTDETFSPRAVKAHGTLFTRHGEEITAVLRFGHRIRDLAAGYHPSRTAQLEDGSLVAEVHLSSPDYAAATVARHGGELSVLEPQELTHHVIDWLTRAQHLHHTTTDSR